MMNAKKLQALELRWQGYSFREIGEIMHTSCQQAQSLFGFGEDEIVRNIMRAQQYWINVRDCGF
jgi:hypothetical protein